jgi:hypothetical protein
MNLWGSKKIKLRQEPTFAVPEPGFVRKNVDNYGVATLSVRWSRTNPWVDVFKSADMNEINRLKTLYENTIVREIVLELYDVEKSC